MRKSWIDSELDKLSKKPTTKRKKPRTAAQKAATAKMLAANAKRRKNPEIHIDVNSHNARRSAKAKTNPAPKKSYIVLKLIAPNDINGNPKRGWLIWFNDGELIGFVDEGHQGRGALREYMTYNGKQWPFIDLGAIEVTGAIYTMAKKSLKTVK